MKTFYPYITLVHIRSCADAFLALPELIRTTIENKTSRQVCFIDFQKAFDTLDYEILLNKLANYGIWGAVLNSLRDYLNERWQFVSNNQNSTTLRKIETSVHQASVLGPLFLLLYKND